MERVDESLMTGTVYVLVLTGHVVAGTAAGARPAMPAMPARTDALADLP